MLCQGKQEKEGISSSTSYFPFHDTDSLTPTSNTNHESDLHLIDLNACENTFCGSQIPETI